MEYHKVEETDKDRWDELAPHPMQSWAWGEFRAKRQPVSRIGRYTDGKLNKVFLVVWTKLPKLDYFFGYVPMSEMPNEEDLERLKDEAVARRGLGIRLEPMARAEELADARPSRKLIKTRGLFKKKTYWWDLRKSEDELLKDMRPKCRYNLRVARKHGVKVAEDSGALDKHLELLFQGTAKRQKIGLHDEHYHRQMAEALGKNARLFTATYRDKVISTIMVFVWKRSAYYAYGGNSLEHKEVMAPTLLVWEVARIMKSEGREMFDLWGAEEGRGFSRFKQQFGAELVELAGSYDLPVRWVGYWLFRLAEEIRWKMRHSS